LPSKKKITLAAPLVAAHIVISVPTTSCLIRAPSDNTCIYWAIVASNKISSIGELLGSEEGCMDGAAEGEFDGNKVGNIDGKSDG
jgi:hypothetical protein